MKIGSIGYNYVHREPFVMDRPGGTGCRLLLLIKEPAIFEIAGTTYNVKDKSVVLFSHSTPYKYHAAKEVYTDDWIFFADEEGDDEYLAEVGIPQDTIIPISNAEELSQLIRTLAYEHYSTYGNHEKIEAHYLEIFWLKLAREVQVRAQKNAQLLSEKNSYMMYLRSRIYTQPEQEQSVPELAAGVGMSCSGFQHLYKKLFGVSVMTDIIQARMEYAKTLLLTTSLTVKEIALRCGYVSEYSFMRQFRKIFGKTPTDFRTIL
ncbi:MAG: helix-turn-helix domain-containing protein [Lachnospiraceae bacterium]|nr:helix-turn-helix domain-containing protein [Lachnospiraceae bacterium]